MDVLNKLINQIAILAAKDALLEDETEARRDSPATVLRDETLAIPHDDTALRELIAKERKAALMEAAAAYPTRNQLDTELWLIALAEEQK